MNPASTNGNGDALTAVEFVFKSTGYKCTIRRVPFFLSMAVRKSMEKDKPHPPMQEVEYADTQRKTMEPNLAHPDYLTALQEWERAVTLRMYEIAIMRAVTDFPVEAVRALRAEMAALGIELQADDRVAFVYDVAAGNPNEVDALVSAIWGLSQPTEEMIANAADSFRGEVSSAERAGDSHAQ